ncbi:PREDICTED: 4-coumarate--CoA ligase 1-like [Vollenhovia emeryi]|uniref:4-coumarate--CoA ligase 1-like n=1 Tax=Vollenhovia emeryi TaxID=411798 RepID=UPI0005F416AC|nr:PREDICTED: 4-coumarate--CoA ligase 1-like [Vollenhovia emeryi]XP_011872348.1 PREDICTED: 4-coumarate--CoA ligase 1-like [Vollenhovia emeryi]
MAEHDSKDFTLENGVYKGKETHKVNKYKSVGEMLWVNIKRNENLIAHVDACTEETITYAELQDKVVKCALWLQKQGVKSDDVISICTHNHLNSIVPCISAAYITAISNPWSENMDLKTAIHILQLTTPKVIFCREKSVDVVSRALKETNYSSTMVVFGKHADAISFSDILNNCNDAEVAKFRYVELDDIKKTACIMHSSGTTGMPKGVQLANYSIIRLSQESTLDMQDTSSIWFSSLYWLSGIMMNFNAIASGSRVILYPEFDEEKTCQLIEKYKVGISFLSTSMINRLLKAGCIKKYSLSSLKTIMFGGSTLKAKVQEELKRSLPHVKLLQAYGMTEIGGAITIQKSHHKNGSCGTVVENVQIKIVDPESGKVLGPNQSGEIQIKALGMMTGYYRNPEATKSTVDEEGWLHTGDIGYFDEDGELFIVDRIKALMKYRGYQISPGEIEGVLLTHPAVLEAAVIGIPHDVDDEHPLAYVTKKPDAKVTEQELIDFIAKNMMDHCKLRGGVIFLDSFPYTGSGKISQKDLKEMAKKLKHFN